MVPISVLFPLLVAFVVAAPRCICCCTNDAQVADIASRVGYIDIRNTNGSRMFYYFAESRNFQASDPLVLWLTGGPGCSSAMAFFYENGPFRFKQNSTGLEWNEFGWDMVANVVYVDQPIGTGFSYSSYSSYQVRSDEDGISEDLYNFLQGFLQVHPQYIANDFYITGESYAGHYIPNLAARIRQGNKAKEGIQINLKGIAIGNGMVSPFYQYPSIADYSLRYGLINKAQYDNIPKDFTGFQNLVLDCNESKDPTVCEQASSASQSIEGQTAAYFSGGRRFNQYDIRADCPPQNGQLCYDVSQVKQLLNDPSVKAALGVACRDFDDVCNAAKIHEALKADYMKNSTTPLKKFLEDGIKVLVYSGEYDMTINFIGTQRWMNALEWSGQEEYQTAPEVPFTVDNLKAGTLKNHGPFTNLVVMNAGHMVPLDQPKVSLEMLQRWMQGTLTCSTN